MQIQTTIIHQTMMPLAKMFRIAARSKTNVRYLTVAVACVAAGFISGCASKPEEKPAHVRGWVGGQYRLVKSFPKELKEKPKAGLLVVAVSTNTPLYTAGLREGDVILELDHQPISGMRDFRRKVDAEKPGASMAMSAWRDGQKYECNVPVGRETFRYSGIFMIGFPPFMEPFQFWPTHDNPGFSLSATGWNFSDKRVELGSVSETYFRKCDPKREGYDENWSFWLAMMKLTKGENILSQEKVEK
jgi:membrane-associated protease RseP (regulator of RpoE activity)